MADESLDTTDVVNPLVGVPSTTTTINQAQVKVLPAPGAPDDGPVLVADTEVADVDPAAWLSGQLDEPEESFGYYYLPNGKGKIKLAALTEKEENAIRTASTRANPKNPSGPRVLQVNNYKRNLIAAAMNKGATGEVVGAITGDQLLSRFSGQVTEMFKLVTKIGGFTSAGEDSAGDEAQDLFS